MLGWLLDFIIMGVLDFLIMGVYPLSVFLSQHPAPRSHTCDPMRTAALSYAACPGPCHLVLPFRRLVVIQDMVLVFLTLTLTLVTIPPTSAASERVFSLLEDMFGKGMEQSLADLIQAALMLRYNKRRVG